MYCKQCGKQLVSDERFCAGCGLPNQELQPPTQPQFNGNYQQSNIQINGMYQAPPTAPSNTMATMGLIFAFIIPIVGLVLSIIGLNRASQFGGRGRGVAIAGIIVSIAMFVLNFILIMSGAMDDFLGIYINSGGLL
ncbi:MAG: hypothetical protein FWE16_02845 [Firmicutes bacterium]|nr:hypothetical protein [Bacillota bacterium]